MPARRDHHHHHHNLNPSRTQNQLNQRHRFHHSHRSNPHHTHNDHRRSSPSISSVPSPPRPPSSASTSAPPPSIDPEIAAILHTVTLPFNLSPSLNATPELLQEYNDTLDRLEGRKLTLETMHLMYGYPPAQVREELRRLGVRIMLAQQAVDAVRWALGIGEIGGDGGDGGASGGGGSRGDYQNQQQRQGSQR